MTDDRGRRAQQRFDVRIPVEVTFQGEGFETFSRNISLGGMFLEKAGNVQFGAVVQLRFSLPDLAGPLTVDAHVRWVQGDDGLGVQFVGLRAREVWALQKLFSSVG
ncbi:MAG: PilZ domain-containing protein [Polyangia bacterium]|nr:PilZ domain-containing protein [Polyangia bacterium]